MAIATFNCHIVVSTVLSASALCISRRVTFLIPSDCLDIGPNVHKQTRLEATIDEDSKIVNGTFQSVHHAYFRHLIQFFSLMNHVRVTHKRHGGSNGHSENTSHSTCVLGTPISLIVGHFSTVLLGKDGCRLSSEWIRVADPEAMKCQARKYWVWFAVPEVRRVFHPGSESHGLLILKLFFSGFLSVRNPVDPLAVLYCCKRNRLETKHGWDLYT